MPINIDINVILFVIIISIFLLLDSLNEFTITMIILSIIYICGNDIFYYKKLVKK